MAVEVTYHNVAVHNVEEVEVENRKGPFNRNLGHIMERRLEELHSTGRVVIPVQHV